MYLAAYDISEPKRLRKALKVLKGFSTGGQKSVFECPLAPVEIDVLLKKVKKVINREEDRFFLIHLEPRSKVRTLGIAQVVGDPAFFYVG